MFYCICNPGKWWDVCGDTKWDLPELYSFTSLPNKRSERAVQKIGMLKEGEFGHLLIPAGHPLMRHVLYRIKIPGRDQR